MTPVFTPSYETAAFSSVCGERSRELPVQGSKFKVQRSGTAIRIAIVA